jgi:hypothetical protein
MMPPRLLIPAALATGALVGHFTLAQSDVPVIALLLIVSAAAFSALHPRRPWWWALLLCAGFVIANAAAGALHLTVIEHEHGQPIPRTISLGEAPLSAISFLFLLPGAFLGAGLRRLISGPDWS